MKRKPVLLNTSGLSGTPGNDELEHDILNFGNVFCYWKSVKSDFSAFEQSSRISGIALQSLYIR